MTPQEKEQGRVQALRSKRDACVKNGTFHFEIREKIDDRSEAATVYEFVVEVKLTGGCYTFHQVKPEPRCPMNVDWARCVHALNEQALTLCVEEMRADEKDEVEWRRQQTLSPA